MFKKFIYCIFLITCVLEATKTVNSDVGQFQLQEYSTACTPIALNAAQYVLTMRKSLSQFNENDLLNIQEKGIESFKQLGHVEPGRFLGCREVINKFPDLLLVEERFGTLRKNANLPPHSYTLQGLKPLLDLLKDVEHLCSILTHSGETYALCHKDDEFIFIDSHRKSDNDLGSHAIVGSEKDMLEHFEKHIHLQSPEAKFAAFNKVYTSGTNKEYDDYWFDISSPSNTQFDSTIVKQKAAEVGPSTETTKQEEVKEEYQIPLPSEYFWNQYPVTTAATLSVLTAMITYIAWPKRKK